MQQALRQGAVPLLLALVLSALHLATGGALDQRLYAAAAAHNSQTPLPEMAVIAIDDASLARHGPWPWPRELLAQLVDRLAAASPRTIVLALPLEGAQSDRALPYLRQIRTQLGSAPADARAMADAIARTLTEAETALDADQRLAHSLKRAGNVLIPARLEAAASTSAPALHLPPFMHRSAITGAALGVPTVRTATLPPDVLGNAAAAVGHWAALPPTEPAPLLLGADGALLPSLALVAAAHSLHLAPSSLRWVEGQGIRLGNALVHAPQQTQFQALPYATGAEPAGLAQYPAHALLSGALPAKQLHDRIVVVGTASTKTPGPSAQAPVQWLAQQISALRQNHTARTPAWASALQWGGALAAVAVLLWALPVLGGALGAGITLALALAMLALQWGAMQSTGLALALTLPAGILLLGLLAHMARTRWGEATAQTRHTASSDPEADRMMGLALQGQGQLDMAFARLRRVRGNPQVLNDLLHLAQEFEQKLRFEQAIEVYTHILRQDREHPEARKRRRRARHLAEVAAHASMPMELPTAGSTQPASLGRYQVEKELGRGAMGVVYQGHDPTIGRVVAIKTLALGQEFEGNALIDARARFFREAESAGRLQHQHIVTIYDAGEEQGLAWIAMELLKGQDLARATDAQHLLPPEQVLGIIARVADALDYAHLQNVVHRDIKPANIMYDADSDTVKVSDFGIARITDSSKTRTGLVLGTPSFMAPEQLAGRKVDGRCDLYALGVTLFQLLTGQLPLRGNSMSELMHHIAHTPAPDVRQLRAELPAALAQVVEQALRKNPQERFQTGRQLASALRSIYATSGGATGALTVPTGHGLDYDGARNQTLPNNMPDFNTTVMDAPAATTPASGQGPGAP